MHKSLGVIIVNYNTALLTAKAALSAVRFCASNTKIVVVDNASCESEYYTLLRELHSSVIVLRSERNLGFARGNNIGIKHFMAQENIEYVLLLNSDAYIESSKVIDDLINALDINSDLAVVGPLVHGVDGNIQTTEFKDPQVLPIRLLEKINRDFPIKLSASIGKLRYVDCVSAVCCLVRLNAIAQVGSFDPSFFMYGEEMELAIRLRKAAWKIAIISTSGIRHLGGTSSKKAGLPQKDYSRIGKLIIIYKHYSKFWAIIECLIISVYYQFIYMLNRGSHNVSSVWFYKTFFRSIQS
jgi:GT2 family glycosyltransferase